MEGQGATTMPFESVRSGPSTLHTPPSYRPSQSFGQRGPPISSTTSSPRSDQENQGDASRGGDGRPRVVHAQRDVLQPSQPANGQNTPKRSEQKMIPSTPGGVFVNRRTLKAGVDYVNNALATFGFPSPLTFVGASAEEAEKTVNCIMAMLLERQKDIEYKTEVDERYRKLQSENDGQHATIQKLQSRLDGERREKEASQLKLGSALAQLKVVEERAEKQADEAVAKEMHLQRACVQHQHEMRKKEREFTRTRDTLQRVMQEQYKGTKVKFTLMNPMTPSSLPAGAIKSKTSMEETMYQLNIRQYEEREEEIVKENELLRQTLYDLHQSMHAVVQDTLEQALGEEEDPAPIDARHPEMVPFYLPFDQVKDRISHLVQHAISTVRAHIHELRHHIILLHNDMAQTKDKITTEELNQLAKTNESLTKRLSEYKDVIEKQSKLLDLSMAKKNETGAHQQMQKELRQGLQQLQEQKAELDEERRKFTEAALRLGKERGEIKHDRDQLAREKRQWVLEQEMAKMPKTPASHQKYTEDKNDVSLLGAHLSGVQFGAEIPNETPQTIHTRQETPLQGRPQDSQHHQEVAQGHPEGSLLARPQEMRSSFADPTTPVQSSHTASAAPKREEGSVPVPPRRPVPSFAVQQQRMNKGTPLRRPATFAGASTDNEHVFDTPRAQPRADGGMTSSNEPSPSTTIGSAKKGVTISDEYQYYDQYGQRSSHP